MRIWFRRAVAAILVMVLLLPGSVAQATEIEESLPEETLPAPTEPIPEETLPASTEPAPEETQPHTYEVDTETEIYRVCDELAAELNFDQLLVYDATNDKMLYTNTREGEKLYPASITKLFSAYVALKYIDDNKVITVGEELSLIDSNSSIAGLKVEDQLTAKQLVAAMLLPSGNDATYTLAAAVGRELADDEEMLPADAVERFVKQMNKEAQKLDFVDSNFVTPDGIHDEDHYICLADMIKIGKLALDHSVLSKYVADDERKLTILSQVLPVEGEEEEEESEDTENPEEEIVIIREEKALKLTNSNLLLQTKSKYYCQYAIGLKTGFTTPAGNCLLSAFEVEDQTLLIGVFGCSSSDKRYADTLKLFTDTYHLPIPAPKEELATTSALPPAA